LRGNRHKICSTAFFVSDPANRVLNRWLGRTSAAVRVSPPGDKTSQLGKHTTILGCLATMSADPASHPHDLTARHVLAIVEGASRGGIPMLPAEICVGPMSTGGVTGAAARRFTALHALADEMRSFALVCRHR